VILQGIAREQLYEKLIDMHVLDWLSGNLNP